MNEKQKKAKAKKDAEFIKKIKTIGIITASPSAEDPSVCEHCHEPIADHIPLILGVIVADNAASASKDKPGEPGQKEKSTPKKVRRRREKKGPVDDTGQMSFSA